MTDLAFDAGEQLASSTSDASLQRTLARSVEIEAEIAQPLVEAAAVLPQMRALFARVHQLADRGGGSRDH